MSTIQLRKQITLRGSAQIVAEFFEYGLNSILFQRALYPPEDFKMVKKYGLNLLVSNDEGVHSYLKQLLSQVERWILAKSVSKLVLAISNKDTQEVVERWQFDISLENDDTANDNVKISSAAYSKKALPKTEKQINEEIAAILRQVTASVSFLPVLSDPCTFNVLAYTDKNAEVPATWEDSDGLLIAQHAEQVKLRSFSTSVHRVDSMVAYKLE